MTERCPTCGGSGQVLWQAPPGSGSWGFGEWPKEMCMTCNGSGWVTSGGRLADGIYRVVDGELFHIVPGRPPKEGLDE